MYIPPAFEEFDYHKLHSFIAENSFGLLVSVRDGVPFATHLPMLLEPNVGPNGRLFGHFAKANPQWRDTDGKKVLAIFSGPHVYVSPSIYESENVVPTWNYVAVHVYGTFRLLDDVDSLSEILTKSVQIYEQHRKAPWVLDTSTPYFHKMVHSIVGFRIEIERLEGKWKLSQNQPAERQEKVMHALAESTDFDAQEIARLMAERLR